MALLTTANDKLLVRVLADRFRADLRESGIGDGRYSFNVELKGLSPFDAYDIAVRRESDIAHLPCSPIFLGPVTKFNPAFREQCAALLADVADDAALTERIAFLAGQMEALLQQRAIRRSRPVERNALRQVKWRCTGGGDQIGFLRSNPLLPRALARLGRRGTAAGTRQFRPRLSAPCLGRRQSPRSGSSLSTQGTADL